LFVLQALAQGKYEGSVWKTIEEDAAIVDTELVAKMFKMNPGALRAITIKQR
jgi:hypothetical protein